MAATVDTVGAALRFTLDKSSSKFTVQAFASGMLSALGHSPTFAIRDFSGEAAVNPNAPAQASLNIRIRAGSLQVTDDIKSSDRHEMESTMNQSVLEIEKYPEILFDSTGVSANQVGEGRYQVNMNGNLTLHGVTRSIAVPLQLAFLGDMFRASGECPVSQSSFGITPVSVAGGSLKLKDELKLTFDIVARKQG
jgi:polyisoprenoid-binding protein YceI